MLLPHVSHKPWLQLYDNILCLHVWAWIGGDKGGTFALLGATAKESEVLYLQVSL